MMHGRFWIIGSTWVYSTNDPYEGLFMIENAEAQMFDRRQPINISNLADPLMQVFASLEIN